jgi:hypothetical protein
MGTSWPFLITWRIALLPDTRLSRSPDQNVFLPPCDGRIRALYGVVRESLLVLGDREQRMCRLLWDVGCEDIERRLGGAREHRVQMDSMVVLEDCLVMQVKGTDAIYLGDGTSVSFQCFRLRPAARQYAPGGSRSPFLARFSATYLVLYAFFLAATRCHVCFLFCQIT